MNQTMTTNLQGEGDGRNDVLHPNQEPFTYTEAINFELWENQSVEKTNNHWHA